MSDNNKTTDANKNKASSNDMDALWGEAMNEQAAAKPTEAVFETLEPTAQTSSSHDLDLILDIPVNMTVELGRTKLTIKELLNLTQGSILALEGLAGEPLDILINGYLIAQGEVVVVGDKYGVRITDIITPSERMHRLSKL